MVSKRVIPVLLLSDGGLVKTTRFSNPVYIGDPVNALRIFNDKEVDELIVVDRTAAQKKAPINFTQLARLAEEAFMPLAYGGGVSDAADIKMLLRLGFEKVLLNSVLHERPHFLAEMVALFGSSTLVAGIDYGKGFLGENIYWYGNSKKKRAKVIQLAKEYERAGAGELLVHHVDADGTMKGFDLQTMDAVANAVDIPVIALGGASGLHNLREMAQQTNVSGIAAGALFVFHGPHRAVLINYPSSEELTHILNG